MKRYLILVCACIIAFTGALFAQGEPGFNKSSLGANFEVSLPTDDIFKEVAGTGYGGNLRYQWGMDARTAITATAGYLVWGKKDLGLNTSVQPKAFNFFIGGKYYFTNGFYGSLDGGFYFLNYTYEGTVVGAEGNTTWFMLPIGIGFQQSGFEVGARYMLLAADYQSFSFTLGYNFAL
jgi:hypothetical protein